MARGGFFKGEKKKSKKTNDKAVGKQSAGYTAIVKMPEVISKKKKNSSW